MMKPCAHVFSCALTFMALSGCSGNADDGTSRRPSVPRIVSAEPSTNWSPATPKAGSAGASGMNRTAAGGTTTEPAGLAGTGGTTGEPSTNVAGAPGARTFNTGGAVTTSSGGASGRAGVAGNDSGTSTTQARAHVEGNLELAFGEASIANSSNCPLAWPSTRGYLTILEGYCDPSVKWCAGSAFTPQSSYAGQDKLESQFDAASHLLLRGFSPRYAGVNGTETIDLVALDTNVAGLAGTGVATLRRHCPPEGDSVYELPVTVGADRTRPVVSFQPQQVFAPYAVSWGELWLKFSEPLDLTNLDASQPVVGLYDADDEAHSAAIVAQPSMALAVSFLDPAEVAGTRQKLYLKTALVDRFGNPATVDPNPIQFVADSLLTDVMDFDVTEPKGLIGHARYVAPGTVDSPCESGGCIVIGPMDPCVLNASPTFFSVRIQADDRVSLKFRGAWFSDSPTLNLGDAIVRDSVQYIGQYAVKGTTLAASHPDAPLAYTTGFVDTTLNTQSARAKGTAFTIECNNDLVATGSEPTRYAWVIERIELIHDGND